MRHSALVHDVEKKKSEVIVKCPSGTEEIIWDVRSELQTLIEKLILQDIDLAISKHYEQDYWNVCYKQCIDLLQRKIRAKPRNSGDEIALLSVFLSASISCLTSFLIAFCTLYNYPCPAIKSAVALGQEFTGLHLKSKSNADLINLQKLAHFCLVHLGDIARYQRQTQAAESYYLHAANVLPSNGHAFNQLGIIENARGNRLSAAAFYTRAIYVATPFPLAATNIEQLFDSALAKSKETVFEAAVDSNPDEELLGEQGERGLATTLLIMHALVHRFEDLHRLIDCRFLRDLSSEFHQKLLSRNGSFDEQNVFNLIILHCGGLHKLIGDYCHAEEKKENFSTNSELTTELSEDERSALQILMNSLWSIGIGLCTYLSSSPAEDVLNSLTPLLYIYTQVVQGFAVATLANSLENKRLKHNFAIVYCNFLNLIQEEGALKRPRGLKIFCALLRLRLASDAGRRYLKDSYALPIDEHLQDFIPLRKVHERLEFVKGMKSAFSSSQIHKGTMLRLVSFGVQLSDAISNPTVVTYDASPDGKVTFTTGEILEPSDDAKKVYPYEKVPITAPAASASKSSKLVAIKTILDKEKETLNKEKEKAEGSEAPPQPRIKIAAPGSNVDLPKAGDKPHPQTQKLLFPETRIHTGDKSSTIEKHQEAASLPFGSKSRFEVPPRFQAQRLKMALGGGGGPSFNAGSRKSPLQLAGEDNRTPNGFMMGPNAFPPLSTLTSAQEPKGTFGLAMSQADMMLPQFSQERQANSHFMSMNGSVATGNGSDVPSSDFPKTPGVRPAGPPKFPTTKDNNTHFPFPTHPFQQNSKPFGENFTQNPMMPDARFPFREVPAMSANLRHPFEVDAEAQFHNRRIPPSQGFSSQDVKEMLSMPGPGPFVPSGMRDSERTGFPSMPPSMRAPAELPGIPPPQWFQPSGMMESNPSLGGDKPLFPFPPPFPVPTQNHPFGPPRPPGPGSANVQNVRRTEQISFSGYSPFGTPWSTSDGERD